MTWVGNVCPRCGHFLHISTTRRRIIEGIAAGMPSKLIAACLGLQVPYVKQETCRAYRQLGVRNRIQLMAYWNCELFQAGLKELGFLN